MNQHRDPITTVTGEAATPTRTAGLRRLNRRTTRGRRSAG